MKRLVDTSVLISYTVSGSNKEPISNIAKGIVAPSLSFSMSTGCSDFTLPSAWGSIGRAPTPSQPRQQAIEGRGRRGNKEEETKK